VLTKFVGGKLLSVIFHVSSHSFNQKLAVDKQLNRKPSPRWPPADLHLMPMLACTALPPNANFGLSDWVRVRVRVRVNFLCL